MTMGWNEVDQESKTEEAEKDTMASKDENDDENENEAHKW